MCVCSLHCILLQEKQFFIQNENKFHVTYFFHIDGRHRNRTVNNNYTYIYHDYYMRAAEGDTIQLCANLSEPQTDPFYLYYYSYYYTTEVNEGLFTQYNSTHCTK